MNPQMQWSIRKSLTPNSNEMCSGRIGDEGENSQAPQTPARRRSLLALGSATPASASKNESEKLTPMQAATKLFDRVDTERTDNVLKQKLIAALKADVFLQRQMYVSLYTLPLRHVLVIVVSVFHTVAVSLFT